MTRISALAALAAADPTDVLPIVDVSATTTKKITKAALLASVYDGTDIAAQAITPTKVNLKVANDAARTALTAFEGLEVYQADTDATYIYDGSAWRKQAQWEELGSTVLGGTATSISVTSFAARKYLQIIFAAIPSGSLTCGMRFNNDSGSNYAHRYEQDNGATSAATSTAYIPYSPAGAFNQHAVFDVINISSIAKSTLGDADVFTDSAGAAPGSYKSWGKWANTSTQITRVDFFTTTNNFAAGTCVAVLGRN